MDDFFPKSPFPKKKIKELVRIAYGKGLAAKEREPNGTVPVYGSNGIIGYHSKAYTKAPAIIIGRKGSVGEINYSEIPCWPIDTSFFIDEFAQDLDSKWLFFCLNHLELGIHAQGPKPGIKRDLLYNIYIPVPQDIAQQRHIVARIEELDRRAEEVDKIAAAIAVAMKSFSSALLAKAFRGEL